MRKLSLSGVAPLMAFVAAAALAAPAALGALGAADGLSLDEGIAQLARGIEDGLPAGTRVAAVNFESPSARFSDYVLEEL